MAKHTNKVSGNAEVGIMIGGKNITERGGKTIIEHENGAVETVQYVERAPGHPAGPGKTRIMSVDASKVRR